MALSDQALQMIQNVMGPLGATLAAIMFLSSLPVIRFMVRNGNVGEYSAFPYVVQACNCALWDIYALAAWDGGKKLWCLVANVVGLAITLPTFLIYTSYCTPKQLRPVLLYSLPVFLGILSFAVYVGAATLRGVDAGVAGRIAGILCLIFNMLMYLGPVAGIGRAISESTTEGLPLSLGTTTVLNSIPWSLYGFAIGDVNIWFPNLWGILFGLVQVACYAYLSSLARAKHVDTRSSGDDGAASSELSTTGQATPPGVYRWAS